ncbi:DUF3304 domain-containing protein [Proteus mirabilis]|uniref:DUF3304 domain-containing protein n=1 Tax=Proteus mirabilis TaxID=584 RepID=UPI0011407036|nr:DUF3304 domain-containing protein [Proteus mirabilis]EHZ8012782.1 DUF3304 domain-containing protein [Proteus mirabilis]EKV1609579.1 DUF3304 domain-containing protein [Proteus mirabilis]EKV2707919.1 DUF3304 domain-containing protein [Proteus mirabilis]EKX5059315.1 DUF3304 domain-containing protein [Proteus mirabilis]MBI6271833.1 DUF3304 domain-containing protein [Proteus mirabilis]
MNRLNVLKKYKRYLYTLIIIALFSWIGWFVWLVLWGPPQGGVSLVIHTQIDRPIRGFSVNGVAGGNAFAYDPSNIYAGDGGKTTCCGSISGDTAEIIWTVDYTQKQYDEGLRTEIHKKTLPLPIRKRGENNLHVFFLPNDEVLLWWGEGLITPWKRGMSKEELAWALAQ